MTMAAGLLRPDLRVFARTQTSADGRADAGVRRSDRDRPVRPLRRLPARGHPLAGRVPPDRMDERRARKPAPSAAGRAARALDRLRLRPLRAPRGRGPAGGGDGGDGHRAGHRRGRGRRPSSPGTGRSARRSSEPSRPPAVGFIAATDNDTSNLSLVASVREINPKLFVIARENDPSNHALFRAIDLDFALIPAEVVAHEVLAHMTSPLLYHFLELLVEHDDAWASELTARLVRTCGESLPQLWRVRLDAAHAPAIASWFAAGRSLAVGALAGRSRPASAAPALRGAHARARRGLHARTGRLRRPRGRRRAARRRRERRAARAVGDRGGRSRPRQGPARRRPSGGVGVALLRGHAARRRRDRRAMRLGIDLGGTKIEIVGARRAGPRDACAARVPTPAGRLRRHARRDRRAWCATPRRALGVAAGRSVGIGTPGALSRATGC